MTSPIIGNREFRDEVISIASLTVTNPTIEGYTFVHCRIIGPAVLGIVDGVKIEHCQFEGEFSSLFWEVNPEDRPLVVGAVGLVNTHFVNCTFQGVGIAGSPDFGAAFEATFS